MGMAKHGNDTVAPKKKKDKKRELVDCDPEDAGANQDAGVDEMQPCKDRKQKKRKVQEEPTAVESQDTSDSSVKKKEDASTSPVDCPLDPAAFRSAMQISSRSSAELPDPVQSLDSAPFAKKLRAALKGAGFTAPTPIQAQGWPVAVQGSDLIAVAKTGSGKTLAFLLPAFRKIVKEQLEASAGPPALVLAPTRELAMQIEEVAVKFATSVAIRSAVVYGGVAKADQLRTLKSKPQLLVATPGRLVDFMSDGTLKLASVVFLVLDEADRMLDMGFEPQMEQIMKQIPAARQTLLFTATWPKSVQKLASKYLKPDAVHVNVGETDELAANKAVTQQFYKLDDDEKDAKLWSIMNGLADDEKIIVFANTKRRINNLQKMVWSYGYDCVAMHGDKTQQERDAGFADFASGKIPLLCATDVCARGLDIRDVSLVVNFDMARDVESYIHRIGRTGRAGSSGVSVTFFNEAYDMACAPALVKIAKEAGQDVPEFLVKASSKAEQQKVKNKMWRY